MERWLSALDAFIRYEPYATNWRSYRKQNEKRLKASRPATAVAVIVGWWWLQEIRSLARYDIQGAFNNLADEEFDLIVPAINSLPEAAAILRALIHNCNQAHKCTLTDGSVNEIDVLRADWQAWRASRKWTTISWNTALFRQAASRKGIPWWPMKSGVDQFGWGMKARRLQSTHTDGTNILSQQLAKNKAKVNEFLREAGLPVARQGVVNTLSQCVELAKKIGFPVVVKPATEDFARGVFVNLRTEESVRSAFERAHHMGPVLVEAYNKGREYRITVVNNRVTCVYERVAPAVTGNGKNSIRDLIQKMNASPFRRGIPNGLAPVEINADMEEFLHEQELDLSSIPAIGQHVKLLRIPLIVNGGSPVDRQDVIHPDNVQLIIRAVRLIGLDVAGVDFMAPDIARSWHLGGCAILEVNSQPLLVADQMVNQKRDYFSVLLEALFPQSDGRIPVVLFGGKEKASNAATLLGEFLCQNGFNGVGVASQAGAWMDREQLTSKSVGGASARDVLLVDPVTQYALIQSEIPDVLIDGLACDQFDLVVLLDAQVGECAEKKVNYVHALAELIRRARRFVVVNVDDPLLFSAVPQRNSCQVILISEKRKAEDLINFLPTHGIVLASSAAGVEICREGKISLLFEAAANSFGLPKLAALAAAIALGVDVRSFAKN